MRLWTGTMDLLFPPKCPFCQKILEQPRKPLCQNCVEQLPWLVGEAAGRKVDFTQGCFSPLAYRDQVSEALRRYKFARVRAYGGPFGVLLAQCVQDQIKELPDAVTWVPLSRRRRGERGFDQAELLARTVGQELSLPVLATLRKERHTKPQSGLLEAGTRRANVSGAYALWPGVDVAGKGLLLVDDVVTTGATLSECAQVLLRSGAVAIWCAALAQARKN